MAPAGPTPDPHDPLPDPGPDPALVGDARLGVLLARQEALVAELQHRVRNILAVVRAVFTQTVEAGTDPLEVADHFRGRLDALARAQVIGTRTAAGTVDLEELLRDELLSVGVHDSPEIRLHGPPVVLPPPTAELLGLALHELTTNACKYGALQAPGATLEVGWRVAADRRRGARLTLEWVERGVPATPDPATRQGFGRRLIEQGLPYQLGAETRLEFAPDGVRCALDVPLPGEDGAPDTPGGAPGGTLLRGRRILVVEDEYFVAEDLQRTLAQAGAIVVGPVPTLKQGLRLAEEPLDAAVLDINLTQALSYPIADRLRGRGVPCLFLTGYDAWTLPERYRDVPHLVKPFQPASLLDAIGRLLAAGATDR